MITYYYQDITNSIKKKKMNQIYIAKYDPNKKKINKTAKCFQLFRRKKNWKFSCEKLCEVYLKITFYETFKDKICTNCRENIKNRRQTGIRRMTATERLEYKSESPRRKSDKTTQVKGHQEEYQVICSI